MPAAVCIFNPQYELAACLPGYQPGEQGRTGTTNVHKTGGTRRKSCPYFLPIHEFSLKPKPHNSKSYKRKRAARASDQFSARRDEEKPQVCLHSANRGETALQAISNA
jgi:hypothetical protein